MGSWDEWGGQWWYHEYFDVVDTEQFETYFMTWPPLLYGGRGSLRDIGPAEG